MAVKTSVEAIRKMQKDIKKTINDIEKIKYCIDSGTKTGEWNDSKAVAYVTLMKNVATLTSRPLDTLKAAVPKLEKLAQAVESYNGIDI